MVSLLDQYHFNVAQSPWHEGIDALPAEGPDTHPVRFIAYYLPQFHPIAVNDEAWGRGFTEWSNVTKALPRYVGHYQPRLPVDLGFYDLRSIETLARQAELARRGGIYGFCIHNYWFAGRRVLEKPLELILANPQIDIRFCLNWANEPWSRRWDGSEDQIIVSQDYSPEADRAYAESMLPAVSDPRYIRVDGRPLVMLYRPAILPDARATVERWREVFVRHGVGDPYVVMAHTVESDDSQRWGFDAVAGFPPHPSSPGGGSSHVRRLDPAFRGIAHNYPTLAEKFIATMAKDYPFHPGVCPNWDNEARKPRRGTSFYGSTPAIYGRWLRAAAAHAAAESHADRRIVFINAWNEWAEGAYLEPDRHYGYAYLAETARALAGVAGTAGARRDAEVPTRYATRETRSNMLLNRGDAILHRLRGLLARSGG